MTDTNKTKRQQAFDIYKEHGGKIDLTEIARMLGSPAGTVRGWKSKDKWDDQLNGTFQKEKRSIPNKKAERSNKGGAPKGNTNAEGNKGGAAPKGNQNAVSHGLFAKYLPDETRDLMTELYTSDPADIIWNNIMIQYSAIIRAQKIMYVRDQYDRTEETVGMSKSVDGQSMTKTFQQAWDKQDQFLSSQSRAMSALSNMIKQFVSLADEKDGRAKKLELMQAQIDQLTGGKETDTAKSWKSMLSEIESGDYGEVKQDG